MRRIIGVIATLGAAGVTALTIAAPVQAAAAPAACSTHWGTNAKHGGVNGTVGTPVRHVRAGQHGCFDRLVIDMGKGAKPPYRVEYVKHIVAEGSGRVLKVRGRAKISIALRGPAGSGFDANGVNLVNVSGFTTFRQVRGAGSFERVTSIGLGVRAKLPMRVFLLGSSKAGWRLVVDLAH